MKNEMMNEEAINELKQFKIDLLPNENEEMEIIDDEEDKKLRMAIDKAIEALNEQRPHGEWLHPYKSDVACECSVCHIQIPITNDFNYCPKCGSDMRESEG